MMKSRTLIIILILLLIGIIIVAFKKPKEEIKVVQQGKKLKPFSNKTIELQNVPEIKLNQTIQVGEYLVRITEIMRTDEYTYLGIEKVLIRAAPNHEFLIFEVEYEKLSREEAEENIKEGRYIIFPVPVGVGDYRGVTFRLAHSEGYEIVWTALEGECKISPSANYTVGWKGYGRCVFYYKKEWNPEYLVLSSWARGIVLILPIGRDEPVAKLKVPG